jgi:UDP-N-acetylglucosamine acyltransferase
MTQHTLPRQPAAFWHPTAIVEPGAEVGEGTTLGAYAIVGRGARLGRGCTLDAHAMVGAGTVLGAENHIFPFAVIGGLPQHKRHMGEPFAVVVGDGNTFREHVTVHAGTERATSIGTGNLFMVGTHVGHDVRVGSRCTFANGVQLAGHVEVEDHVTFGGLAAVAQFVRVGEGSFVAGGAMVERDVPPFVIAQGDRARVRVLNVIGLRRMGVPEASIAELERVFRAL